MHWRADLLEALRVRDAVEPTKARARRREGETGARDTVNASNPKEALINLGMLGIIFLVVVVVALILCTPLLLALCQTLQVQVVC